ncbi:MAG: septum formation initiator family protein [Syntrophomonas sp.]|nr:septum formation initiator family protein [Syntrophomonas sp.]
MVRTKASKRKRPLWFLMSALLCALLLFSIVPRAKVIYELSVREKELQKEKVRLTQINEERRLTLESIDSPEAIERIAREQLGMVKKGEITIRKVIQEK